MSSSDNLFAELFDDFKSGSKKPTPTFENQNLNQLQTFLEPKKNTSTCSLDKNKFNLGNDFDDLFGFKEVKSTSSSSSKHLNNQSRNKHKHEESVDDLLMNGFEELMANTPKLEKKYTETVKTQESFISIDKNDLNPFETAEVSSENLRLTSTDFFPTGKDTQINDTGFFSITSQLFNQGKKFVESQLNFDSNDRLTLSSLPQSSFKSKSIANEFKNEKKQKILTSSKNVSTKDQFNNSENLLCFDSNFQNSNNSILNSKSPLLDIEESGFNKTFDSNFQTSKSGLLPSQFTNQISTFEFDSYFDFKGQALKAFKLGDFTTAAEKFKLASKSIPKNHIFQVIVYRNLLTTLLKIGDVSEMGKLLDKVLNLLPSSSFNDWSLFMFKEDRQVTLGNLYKKILLCQCNYLEVKENYTGALEVYKLLLNLGFSDKDIIKEKQRLECVVNPPKKNFKNFKKPPAQNLALDTKKSTKPSFEKNTNNDDSIIIIKKHVNNQINFWCGDKAEDLRFLLSTLQELIPDWTPVELQQLISPKKCKIYYFKAINKTHPDKISASSSKQTQILFESIFMALNKAWVKFKLENNL
ncbi:hypothetical protein QEN19_001602 [Hanseniaspora menglaensis]